MKLTIKISDEAGVENLIELKRLIDLAAINGLERADVAREKPAPNQRGAGKVLNLMTVLIKDDPKPITELVKCLQAFVNDYAQSVDIETGDGKNIKIVEGTNAATEVLIKSILQ